MTGNWTQEIKSAVRRVDDLLSCLGLKTEDFDSGIIYDPSYPVFVPEAYLNRIRPGDPDDPLLLQVLPQVRENENSPGYCEDPLLEEAAALKPGILKKYHGRILVCPTSSCAINCRYCFRRSYRFNAGFSKRVITDLGDVLCSDQTISEVILSGGDPLMLDDDTLGQIISTVEESPGITRLRIHTRMPVVLPNRITSPLIRMFGESRLKIVVVVHSNHPAEIDSAVSKAAGKLVDSHVVMLNQSVLLRKVNDTADILSHLCERLFTAGIIPYYIHLLDRVSGTRHFEVKDQDALRIMECLRARLPGYLLPRMVREIPGKPYKVPL